MPKQKRSRPLDRHKNKMQHYRGEARPLGAKTSASNPSMLNGKLPRLATSDPPHHLGTPPTLLCYTPASLGANAIIWRVALAMYKLCMGAPPYLYKMSGAGSPLRCR